MSAAERVAHAAETIRARWERDVKSDPQTEAAQALEDTGQLLDPEVAAELAAFRKADVLPVPAGPEPQRVDAGPVVRPVELAEAQLDALAASGDRAVNDAAHEDLCACDEWPEKCLSSGGFFQGYWDVGSLETAIPAVLGLWERMRGGELERLWARVAELETDLAAKAQDAEAAVNGWGRARERITELEAERTRYVGREPTVAEEMAYLSRCIDSVLDLCDAAERKGIASGGPFTVEAVRKAADGLVERRSYPPALPWARLMDDEDRADFLNELADSATTHASSHVVLADVEDTIARWRLIAEAQHGHNTAPGPDAEERPVNGLTAVYMPVASLREDSYGSPLHRDCRVGRDLPETGDAE